MLVLCTALCSASSIYTDQMNIEPNGNRTLHQTILSDVATDIKVVTDASFNVTGVSLPGFASGNNYTWSNVSVAEFNMTSPNNCIEGKVYRMPVYLNGTLFSFFSFICVTDNKVVDYKAEYGHGDSNYLTCPYIPAETNFSIFNLIRVYTYGSYLNPNEPGLNASIQCTFPNYLVKVRQHNEGTEIIQNDNNVTANFFWTSVDGNWFRVAPLEEDVYNLSVNFTYNVSCDDLIYYYTTGRMRASFQNYSLEARSTQPMTANATVDSGDKGLIYRVINTEKYSMYDIEFKWYTEDGDTYTENIKQLNPNDTAGFEVFLKGHGNLTLEVSFVPCWQQTSLKPMRYSQSWRDPFYFDTGIGAIDRVVAANLFRNASNKRVTLTSFPDLLADNLYKARLVFEVDGTPTDADVFPEIRIFNPDNVEITSGNMTKINIGTYEFSYNVTSLMEQGIWMTETNTTYLGIDIPRFDYWELVSNPAQIRVVVTNDCLTEITGLMTIQNEGTGDQEYQYQCWITPNINGGYNDFDTLNKMSGAKLIKENEQWQKNVTLDIGNEDGVQYLKCEVFFGTKKSSATAQFRASYCRSVSTSNNLMSSGGGISIQELIPTAVPEKAQPVVFTALGSGAGYMCLFFFRKRKGALYTGKGQKEELPPPTDDPYGNTMDMTDERQIKPQLYKGQRGLDRL